MLSRAVVAAKRSVKVGVDYGTYGSGFMHSSEDSGKKVQVFSGYPDQPNQSVKNLTTILYKDGTPVAWGWSANKMYLSLSEKERLLHDYVFLKNIKLAIAPSSGYKLPAGMDALEVTADYLRYLSQFALAEMRRVYGAAFHADLVQWCLTVPANWDEAAKSIMRSAACKAGMVREADALVIVYEPEAAALAAKARATHAHHAIIQSGEIFMVVDAGGGTVDVTMHRAVERNDEVVLSETNYCRGAFAGSTFVDEQFRNYFKHEVGEEAYDTWLHMHPEESLRLDADWEAIKCRFIKSSSSPDGCVPYVPVPQGLLDLMTEADKLALSCDQDGYDDRVCLVQETIKGFFHPVVQQVLQLVEDQLQAAGNRRYDKLLLVGGFAESPYLQTCIKEAVIGRVGQVVIPPHPQKVVVEGAVLYGCNPDLISTRASRLTYGIREATEWEEGAPTKLWVHEEGCHYTDSAFRTFVLLGQLIKVEEAVEHVLRPLHKDQRECDIDLYATEQLDAKYVPIPSTAAGRPPVACMQHVGVIKVILPPDMRDHATHNILVRLHFGRTEITMSASDMQTGQEYQTKVVFAHHRVAL